MCEDLCSASIMLHITLVSQLPLATLTSKKFSLKFDYILYILPQGDSSQAESTLVIAKGQYTLRTREWRHS